MNFSLDRASLLFACFFVFWIWMIIDCVTKETEKARRNVCLLVIALVGCVGAPIYFFFWKLRRKRAQVTLSS